ncbi:anaerobic carbon-monoxide dehydrogenase catalytic subunit [Thermodesulforhabdus norvegica]|uniref:Carbon monoxide dehydrogenase n=1 Tax=Thermodesulforhabdus norvegica TaxID=39841 RepID=A0A1I4SU37_9BACT|nr:anaerobic carbon-monoxide dehydrogenase catalytic subunit [Thermodesulforhabdus norvegica]SFM67813.1 Ni-dependent carbon monoxide dehydrogenase precursor [Thermodesulforhabdus norvegica]
MGLKEPASRTITEDGRLMLARMAKEGIETAWDRYEAQLPHCGFCELGLSCRNCVMGPCRIDPFGEGAQKGVCGADADIIVARNLCRMIAAGAASHSDHGRDLLEILKAVSEGKAPGYTIRDEAKLRRLAAELGINADDHGDLLSLAGAVAERLEEDFGTRKKAVSFVKRVPEKRLALWQKLNIVPRGIDREVVEMMHRTHMGVDNDWKSLLLHGLRTALADGWGGSMIATEISDVLFGVPKPVESSVNLGVLKKDQVNIVLHGHNPLVSEMIAQASQDESLLELARKKGASGINLAGLCCTGNEILMRRGIPMAGNHLMTELVLATGAVEMMIVDYQCIMPALGDLARCYHTRMISTSEKARFPHMEHREFHPEGARELAYQLVKEAVENFPNRIAERVYIPVEPVKIISGFSVEALLEAMGNSLDPLLDAVKNGLIKGAVGVVGCNNPRIRHDFGHVTLTGRLIANDILVVDTGCAAVAHGKAGLKQLKAAEKAGPGLRKVCETLSIPPVLHVGSCVDNIRILVLAAALANSLGVDISDLPIAAAAPEWYSEKAVAIACYAVASGIYTVLGVTPPIMGSRNIVGLLTSGLKEVVGATFAVESDPERAADLIIAHVNSKRKALGLS